MRQVLQLGSSETVSQNSSGSLSSEQFEIARHQRYVWTAADSSSVVVVTKGVLAVDVTIPKLPRQILDFLIPGDKAPTALAASPRYLSLRAITDAALSRVARRAANAMLAPPLQQEMRAYRHLVMLGHLSTEARFATFLLDHAARMGLTEPHQLLALPMSRDDIADYLAINHDTLSRIFMKFEKLDVIERVKRHAVRILDFGYLTRSTPLSPLRCGGIAPESVTRRCVSSPDQDRSLMPST
jgi:CRP/FNR family transcriptional regulator